MYLQQLLVRLGISRAMVARSARGAGRRLGSGSGDSVTSAGMDPESTARSLHDRDPSATAFGIELVAVDADSATVRMLIRPEMCNGFEMIHGGMTFVLADSAMAFASNTTAEAALATGATIDWLAPARPGQVLTAVATRAAEAGRSTVWNISVTDENGGDVALVRGTTRRVGPRPPG